MKNFITGCAGFIGSSMTDRLLSLGEQVIGYDDFSTGQREFLRNAQDQAGFELVEGDLLDQERLNGAMAGCDAVWHFAANADVRHGLERPRRDLEQNAVATSNVLEAMRENGIKRIFFSSSGSIYGEAQIFPTPENAPFEPQTSLYGASKVACEGLISAYCEGYGFKGTTFRFVSILGERYTHGHVFDFVRQLLDHSGKLEILGDGFQRKSYLYVQDCLDAMLGVRSKQTKKYDVFNLGADEYCEVRDSVAWICARMDLKPQISFKGGQRGWIGDNPFIYLDTAKIRSLGWNNRLSIKEGVERTVDWLLTNQWVYRAREEKARTC